MKAEWINPFIRATKETCKVMLDQEVQRTNDIQIHDAENWFTADITAIISLTGAIKGNVAISFDKKTAIAMTASFCQMSVEETEEDQELIAETVGELVNIIAGQSKDHVLSDDHHFIDISLPKIIISEKQKIHAPKNSKFIKVPFELEFGTIYLEVSLVEA